MKPSNGYSQIVVSDVSGLGGLLATRAHRRMLEKSIFITYVVAVVENG